MAEDHSFVIRNYCRYVGTRYSRVITGFRKFMKLASFALLPEIEEHYRFTPL